MTSVVSEIKADVEKGAADLRKSAPELLAKLGVNTDGRARDFPRGD